MAGPTEIGVTFCANVRLSASRNTVEAHETGTLRVRVTAPPKDEKANDAVVSLLAKTLDVAKSRGRIVRGHSSRQKVISVESLTLEELPRRLNDVTGVNRR